MRSWLLVPAEDEDKVSEAAASGADVVVLDLDHARSESARDEGRERAGEWMQSHREQVLEGRNFARWVRISPIESQFWRQDLRAALQGRAEGIFLPDALGPGHVQQLAAEFYEIEQSSGIAHGATQIVPLVASNPQAAMTLEAFATQVHQRLAGFGWDGERLMATLGARRQIDEDGRWCGAFALARAQIVLIAKANGRFAIESAVSADVDDDAFSALAKASRADGFSGMFAKTAQQVRLINEAFEATDREIGHAQSVVDGFTSNPNADHVRVGARLADRNELEQAMRMLEMANGNRH